MCESQGSRLARNTLKVSQTTSTDRAAICSLWMGALFRAREISGESQAERTCEIESIESKNCEVFRALGSFSVAFCSTGRYVGTVIVLLADTYGYGSTLCTDSQYCMYVSSVIILLYI